MTNGKASEIKNKDPNQCCSCRDVLWYIVFAGFAVNYMVRMNLNIAIVSMVLPKPEDNISLTSECITRNPLNSNLTTLSFLNQTNSTSTQMSNSTLFQPNLEGTYFYWNERDISFILGSFFWFHWTTQIPGGVLATKFGTKRVFGLSNSIGVAFNFIIPWCAHRGAIPLIFLRSIQGLCLGVSWPSMHNLVSNWIPPNNRSKFISAYMGSSFGIAITYPLCGLIIERWGWEAAFYICGVIGTIWSLAWWLLVYDSPSEHPRITPEEKKYIITSIGKNLSDKKPPIPWKAICTDSSVWAGLIVYMGTGWSLYTLMVNIPTYFKFIHGWDIRSTGFISGMPHLLRIIFSYTVSMFGDFLLRTEKISRTNVRKLATFCSNGLEGLCALALAYVGCNKIAAIVMSTLAVSCHGAITTGVLAGQVDRSPNYSAILLGITNSGSTIIGFFATMVVGLLTFQNNRKNSGSYSIIQILDERIQNI
ncbi:putative inorganic phosphate cotransporter isoform X2 [Diabrotica undecimpunctata]|uniref:putative inorganic phosphate cotransporter isoform X2 n=1 Tax=Diabrotica undecimpunctata TaxID=50387 RepID=UPI003B6375F8